MRDLIPKSTLNWTAANALGFALAFLSFMPGMMVADLFMPAGMANIGSALPEALDPGNLPDWLDRETYEAGYKVHLVYHLFALGLFGIILGLFQAGVLRRHFRPAWPWVLASAAGFVAILSIEAIERHVVTGPYAGPVEPIVIAFGGGGLAGVFQWLYLRWRGINASKWLILWVVGIAAGIVAAAAILTALSVVLEPPVKRFFSEDTAEVVGWSIMLLVYGAVIGGTAGLISRRSILGSVRLQGKDGDHPAAPAV